jgi:hypothetical protein
MRDLTIHLYRLEELSVAARRYAIDRYRYYLTQLVRPKDYPDSEAYLKRLASLQGQPAVVRAIKQDDLWFTRNGTPVRPSPYPEDNGDPAAFGRPVPGEGPNEITYWVDLLGERYVLYKKTMPDTIDTLSRNNITKEDHNGKCRDVKYHPGA